MTSTPDRLDVDFNVPFRHRLRFTENLLEKETEILVDLL